MIKKIMNILFQKFGVSGKNLQQQTLCHQDNTHRIFISVNGFQFHSFDIENNEKITCIISTKSQRFAQSKEFIFCGENTKPQNWSLKYRNRHRSSFILTLIKKQEYKSNIQLGQIEIFLSNFKPNEISNKTLFLKSEQNVLTAQVNISVCIYEGDSKLFSGKTMSIDNPTFHFAQ